MGVEITTGRLRLRPLHRTDAAQGQALASGFAVTRGLPRVSHSLSGGEARQFTAACMDGSERALSGERALIGSMGLEGPVGRQNLNDRLGARSRVRGYAGEAARVVARRIVSEALVDSAGRVEDNAASLRRRKKPGLRGTDRHVAPCPSLGANRSHVGIRSAREARA